MEEFSKYFKSMIENIIKSGGGEVSFDIKSFDANNAPDFFQNVFGTIFPDKKEKLAVRKLSDEELENYKELIKKQDQLKSQLKKLLSHQKKLEIDFDLFWQDIQDTLEKKVSPKKLSVDVETGFLFQEAIVSKKEDQET